MTIIKNDFPIFETYPNLIYLDNASTTQKPQIMLDSLQDYYCTKNSNIGRGAYDLAEKSENAYKESRKIIANFIGATKKNIVFTKGCTESLNQIAYICSQILKPKQKIVLSIFEHHANILPWQRIAKECDLEIVFISDSLLLSNPENIPKEFWKNVGIISLSHVSNVTGHIHPIEKWCTIAKENNIISCIDGAQGIVSDLVDVTKINCDFYCFSGHKLYGPMGVGVLYISNNIMNLIVEPLILGGGIIDDVQEQQYILSETTDIFEAGTPNVADVYALAQTILYLLTNNWKKLLEQSQLVNNYLLEKLHQNNNVHVIAPSKMPISHMASFTIKDIHPHDIGTFLSSKNVAVRVGKHCTHPLHQYLQLNSSIRASIGIYNTYNDIDILLETIEKAQLFFGR